MDSEARAEPHVDCESHALNAPLTHTSDREAARQKGYELQLLGALQGGLKWTIGGLACARMHS